MLTLSRIKIILPLKATRSGISAELCIDNTNLSSINNVMFVYARLVSPFYWSVVWWYPWCSVFGPPLRTICWLVSKPYSCLRLSGRASTLYSRACRLTLTGDMDRLRDIADGCCCVVPISSCGWWKSRSAHHPKLAIHTDMLMLGRGWGR